MHMVFVGRAATLEQFSRIHAALLRMKAWRMLMRCLLVLAWTLFVIEVNADDRPNILLITADDLGLQLSCYGDKTIETPNLDALAASGVQFTTAYVAQASCSPSRSAMLTGIYPHSNGQYGLTNAGVGFRLHERLLDDLLPNRLKRAGYRTGIIGKLHVDPEKAFQFDTRVREGFGSRDIGLQVDKAKAFWNASSKDPWFLMFNVFDPHVARQSRPNKTKGPQYFPNVVKGIPEDPLGQNDVEPWPWQQIATDAQLKKVAGYYNCVKRIDVAIGRLMESLDATGEADNTLIVFLGDHGPPFSRGKTSCYESGLRVPFLVRWPGVSEPHVSKRLVSSVDIYPTIMDAVGIDTPQAVQGMSLRPMLSNSLRSALWRDTLVGEFHYHGAGSFFPRRAITDGRYKLIHNLRAGEAKGYSSVDGDRAATWAEKRPNGDPVREAFARWIDPPEWELFDLEKDPIEFENRVDDETLEPVLTRLSQSLNDWQEQTNDPFRDPAFRDSVLIKYVK